MVFQEDSGYGGLFSALSRQTEQLTIFTNTVTPGKIQHFSILWMIQLLQTLFFLKFRAQPVLQQIYMEHAGLAMRLPTSIVKILLFPICILKTFNKFLKEDNISSNR